jgi:hypothetical protein
MVQQWIYVLQLLLMVHVIYAILQIHHMQQQSVLASVLCYRRVAVARRAASARKRRSPAVYVRARSTSWTEIVLRPDLFEDQRFKFFFRIPRSRFENLVALLGESLTRQDTKFRLAVRASPPTCMLRVRIESGRTHLRSVYR